MAPTPDSTISGKATRLELRILGQLLQFTDCKIVLEIGAGRGRLLDCLSRTSGRLVELDSSPDDLRSAAGAWKESPDATFVVGDGHRLPFASGTFSPVILVRVFHLSPRPDALIAEIHRVLQPGGVLVLSYYPRPSIRTLQYHLWKSIRSPRGGEAGDRTESGGGRDRIYVGEGRYLSATATDDLLRRGGFEIERRIGAGFEEITGLAFLPEGVFISLQESLPNAWGYPAWFERLRRTGNVDMRA